MKCIKNDVIKGIKMTPCNAFAGDGSNSLLLVDTLGTRSCPSSPNLTPRTRKKTPFNWNEAAAAQK